MSPKTPVVAVRVGTEHRAYPVPWLLEAAGSSGTWEDNLGGRTLRFTCTEDPPTVTVRPGPGEAPVDVVHALWFAWHALHPGAPIMQPVD